MIRDMGCDADIKLHVDATVAQAMANRQGTGKIRHLEVKYLWLQEMAKSSERRPWLSEPGRGVCVDKTWHQLGSAQPSLLLAHATQCIQPLVDLFGSSCKTVIPLTLSSLGEGTTGFVMRSSSEDSNLREGMFWHLLWCDALSTNFAPTVVTRRHAAYTFEWFTSACGCCTWSWNRAHKYGTRTLRE